MTNPNPQKTKQQLMQSAKNSLWIALLIAAFPLFYVIDYAKLGYIYTGKSRIIVTTGIDALIIMYGTIAVAIIAALFAIYNIVRCITKIRRGEYSSHDESPEFVVCENCKTPQYSKDLIEGRCARCNGTVVSLEGYYDHPASSRDHTFRESTLWFAIVSILKMIFITALVIFAPFFLLYLFCK